MGTNMNDYFLDEIGQDLNILSLLKEPSLSVDMPHFSCKKGKGL